MGKKIIDSEMRRDASWGRKKKHGEEGYQKRLNCIHPCYDLVLIFVTAAEARRLINDGSELDSKSGAIEKHDNGATTFLSVFIFGS